VKSSRPRCTRSAAVILQEIGFQVFSLAGNVSNDVVLTIGP
jgi:hypothetical protein